MIRVLVADDSPTARALLVQILRTDPEIEVVGEARDGFEAVAMAARLRPDLITMDLHMPGLDGLGAAHEIMVAAPTPIVIVTGSSRACDIEASLELLTCGALDVLFKPPDPRSPGFDPAARRLLLAVRAMASVKVVRRWRPAAQVHLRPLPDVPEGPLAHGSRHPLRVRGVAVAASTGGPAALQQLVGALPASYPLPILVVQHITSGFAAGLATWLEATTALKVKLAQQGEPIRARTVYIAPDETHMGVVAREHGEVIELSTRAPIGGFRPSASYLFDAMARTYGASMLALILTGMGDDGVIGLRAVRRAGGQVIAQNQATSVVFGMPGAAVAAGVVSQVLSLDAIAEYLLALAGPL